MKVLIVGDRLKVLEGICVVNNDKDISDLEKACINAGVTLTIKSVDKYEDLVEYVKSEGDDDGEGDQDV